MKRIRRFLLVMGVIGVLIVQSSICTQAEEYEYDALNRVTKVTYEDGSYVEYEYDSNGNLLKTNVYNAGSEEDEGEPDGGEETNPSEGEYGSTGSGDENPEDKEETEDTENGDSDKEDVPKEDSKEKNVVEIILEAVVSFANKVLQWIKSWFW